MLFHHMQAAPFTHQLSINAHDTPAGQPIHRFSRITGPSPQIMVEEIVPTAGGSFCRIIPPPAPPGYPQNQSAFQLSSDVDELAHHTSQLAISYADSAHVFSRAEIPEAYNVNFYGTADDGYFNYDPTCSDHGYQDLNNAVGSPNTYVQSRNVSTRRYSLPTKVSHSQCRAFQINTIGRKALRDLWTWIT